MFFEFQGRSQNLKNTATTFTSSSRNRKEYHTKTKEAPVPEENKDLFPAAFLPARPHPSEGASGAGVSGAGAGVSGVGAGVSGAGAGVSGVGA